MVIVDIKISWVGTEQMERAAKILAIKQSPSKYGISHTLEVSTIEDLTQTRYKMDVYGENLNYLIYQFGADTDKWIGQVIIIGLGHKMIKGETKEVRVIRLPK